MSGPVPSQGGRIRPYSSLYGHDLTNVDISGGGSLVQLSRGTKMTPSEVVDPTAAADKLLARSTIGNVSIYDRRKYFQPNTTLAA